MDCEIGLVVACFTHIRTRMHAHTQTHTHTHTQTHQWGCGRWLVSCRTNPLRLDESDKFNGDKIQWLFLNIYNRYTIMVNYAAPVTFKKKKFQEQLFFFFFKKKKSTHRLDWISSIIIIIIASNILKSLVYRSPPYPFPARYSWETFLFCSPPILYMIDMIKRQHNEGVHD